MKTICAWCGKTLKNRRESLRVQITRAFSQMWKKGKGVTNQEEMVSHGICEDCKKELLQSIDEE